MTPFHLAFKVKDLESTRRFYVEILGCAEGRSTDRWLDFDFFGHQLSAHVNAHLAEPDFCGQVDGVAVPIPHFGCVLDLETFGQVEARLRAAGVDFVIAPQTRYEGQVGEQRIMFILDPSGNPIEFKAFRDPGEMFAR